MSGLKFPTLIPAGTVPDILIERESETGREAVNMFNVCRDGVELISSVSVPGLAPKSNCQEKRRESERVIVK